MNDGRLKARFPYAYSRDNLVLLEPDGDGLKFWWCELSPTSAMSEVRRVHGRSIRSSCVIAVTQLQEKIQSAYSDQSSSFGGSTFSEVSELESSADLTRLLQDMPAVEDLLESIDDAPIIRMLNLLLTHAARDGASDIHIEPYERHSSVRFRVDGVLRDVVQPNRALHAALISRLKIMAQLDIAEKRLPQDGRISLRLGSQAVDVRVSTIPNAHGERAVLRLLDKSRALLTLEAMGMEGRVLQQMEQLIAQPHGIVLVTGPTGSGKTTTLYAALQRLDLQHHNIMTVEDPIEYELAGVGQMQVNAKIDLTFAKALRAILRQDPDTIMIGEIRDYETAHIAIQASLTGHLVLATLHTNDAASAINRLVDMGVEPYLLSSSLLGVLAQRLVRKRCVPCSGEGCAQCNASGYAGRTGIFELLVNTPDIRQLIHERADEARIRATAVAQGMTLLREDAQRLIDAQVTTLAEVLHVTRH